MFGCVTTCVTYALYAITNTSQTIHLQVFYAPEWTRTTTLFTQDKALNLVHPV